jgi:hypothetical protein
MHPPFSVGIAAGGRLDWGEGALNVLNASVHGSVNQVPSPSDAGGAGLGLLISAICSRSESTAVGHCSGLTFPCPSCIRVPWSLSCRVLPGTVKDGSCYASSLSR